MCCPLATIIFIGLDGAVEGEGHDRYGIDLPGNQTKLVLEVSKKAKGPCILVFIGGGCVDMTAFKTSPHIDAIVIAGYPRQEGGRAIAQTLFGDNNPSGRLTPTWYASKFIQECLMFDMNMRPNASTGCPGRTHRFYTGTPVFKFGEGMGYSRMQYTTVTTTSMSDEQAAGAPLHLRARALDAAVLENLHRPHLAPAVVTVEVTVENVGVLDGDEVVLVMIKPPPAAEGGAPAQMLRNYERISVRAGGTVTAWARRRASGRCRSVPPKQWRSASSSAWSRAPVRAIGSAAMALRGSSAEAEPEDLIGSCRRSYNRLLSSTHEGSVF